MHAVLTLKANVEVKAVQRKATSSWYEQWGAGANRLCVHALPACCVFADVYEQDLRAQYITWITVTTDRLQHQR